MKNSVCNFVLSGLLLLLVVFPSNLLRARENREKRDPAFEKIESFLKENTYLLIHVDLNKVDIDGIFDQIRPRVLKAAEKIATMPQAQSVSADEMKTEIEKILKYGQNQLNLFVDRLKASNVEELFVLGQMETMQTCPVALIFPDVSALDEELVRMFDMMHILEAGSVDGSLFFSLMAQRETGDPKSFLTVFNKLRTKERTEFNKALRLQAKSPIRVIFAPSAGMKGLLQFGLPEMLAQLPAGSVDTKKLSSVIQKTESISAGVNLAEPRLNLAIQYPTEDDAQKTFDFLVETIDAVIKAIADAAASQAGIQPTSGEAIKDMVVAELPKVNKDRLIYTADSKKFETHEDMLIMLLYPAIVAARQAAEAVRPTP